MVLELVSVWWCVLVSTVPVVSWICEPEACVTEFTVSFDLVDVAAGVDEEEVLMEFAMPNWSDHWKSPVFAMILRP